MVDVETKIKKLNLLERFKSGVLEFWNMRYSVTAFIEGKVPATLTGSCKTLEEAIHFRFSGPLEELAKLREIHKRQREENENERRKK